MSSNGKVTIRAQGKKVGALAAGPDRSGQYRCEVERIGTFKADRKQNQVLARLERVRVACSSSRRAGTLSR